jgi:hypothetical protein
MDGYPLQGRTPRPAQSLAARVLLQELCSGPDMPDIFPYTTKSHSRAVVAAAAGDHTIGALGIDVEFMAEGRPFRAILSHFAQTLPETVDSPAFYRGWTFLEAYFKAFQRYPAPADLSTAITRPSSEAVWLTQDAASVLQHRIGDAFSLSLVWNNPNESTPKGALQQSRQV